MRAFKAGLLGFAAFLLAAGIVEAAELKVMNSGGFAAAYRSLAPEFERATGNKVDTAWGPSMGTAPDAIPVRLTRGEPADVLIMVGSALEDLIKQGKVVAGSRVDLARSRIGMAVRAGAPKPDIGSVEAFKGALLAAKSIAYSDSASGVYVANELYKRLGAEAQLAPKSKKIVSERVGNVVARGDAPSRSRAWTPRPRRRRRDRGDHFRLDRARRRARRELSNGRAPSRVRAPGSSPSPARSRSRSASRWLPRLLPRRVRTRGCPRRKASQGR
jgi:hypothetical protein